MELSTGKVRPKPWLRGGRGPPRSRRAFNPDDRCYECGERGHYAYDCSRNRRGGGGSSSRRKSRLVVLSIMFLYSFIFIVYIEIILCLMF